VGFIPTQLTIQCRVVALLSCLQNHVEKSRNKIVQTNHVQKSRNKSTKTIRILESAIGQ